MEKRIFTLSAIGGAIMVLVAIVRFVSDLASLPEGLGTMLIFVSGISPMWASAIFCIGLIAVGSYFLWRAIVWVGDGIESISKWAMNRYFPKPPEPPTVGAGEIQIAIWEADILLGPNSWMNPIPSGSPHSPEEMLAEMAPMLFRLRANGIELYHPPVQAPARRRLEVVVAQLKAVKPWIEDGRMDLARQVATDNLHQLQAAAEQGS